MRLYLLLFSLIIDFLQCFPIESKIDIADPAERGVLPNIDGYYCTNSDFRQAVADAIRNISNPNAIAVDQIQAAIETKLMPKFTTMGGTWLVSVTSFHRVKGYVDDRAVGMDTFCVINDVNARLYIVILKIDK